MSNKNFVIKNGIEVNGNLIYGDRNSGKIGINTNNPISTLDIDGDVNCFNINITGISTANDLYIDGDITIGGSIGVNNQFIVKTGYGQTWASLSSPRTRYVYTAGIGSTDFSATYDSGNSDDILDVFINGALIPPTEYTANTGTNILLNDPAFGGETIQIIVYNSLI